MNAKTPFERALAGWLDASALGPAPAGLHEALIERVRHTRQRPHWLTALRGTTFPPSAPAAGRPVARARLDLRLTIAAVAVAAVAVVTVAVGAGLVLELNSLATDGPSNSPVTAVPTQLSTAPAPSVASSRIVFTRTTSLVAGEGDCTPEKLTPERRCSTSFIVIANGDGSGERRLFPDGPSGQFIWAAFPDGARLIVSGILPGQDYIQRYLTDASGTEAQVLDTGCTAPCAGDDGFAFSPDGSRLAFVRGYGSDPAYPSQADSTVIAIMELSTGTVAELASTRVANPDLGAPCGSTCGEGTDEAPHWSPDGQQLLFTRYGIGIRNQPRVVLDTTTFVVDADGANLRQLVPTELFARDAQWSPDGSLIVFTSAVEWLTVEGSERVWNSANDLYTVHPDGNGLLRLTTDSTGGVRDHGPRWTRDGRIVFTRTVPSPSMPYPLIEEEEVWVMGAHGQNATRLDLANVATLTAIGCVVCPAPITDPWVSLSAAYWVPGS